MMIYYGIIDFREVAGKASEGSSASPGGSQGSKRRPLGDSRGSWAVPGNPLAGPRAVSGKPGEYL